MHNSSIQSIFLAGIIAFIIPFLFCSNKLVKTIAGIISVPAIIYIFFLNGRAGIIGLLVATLFTMNTNTKLFSTARRKVAVITLSLIFVLIAIFYIKPNSSTGRLHIYSISLDIYKESWLTGVGTGRFKAVFNEYQAAYFTSHDIDGEIALLADNTFYAFNDYLQWTIETGLSGTILLFFTLFCLAYHITILYKKQRAPGIIIAACSGLLCIGIACLFSYPMQVWAVQFLTLFFVFIILFYPCQVQLKGSYRLVLYFFRLLFIVAGFVCLHSSYEQIIRRLMEKQASQFARTGYKNKAIDAYTQLVNKWPAQGHNRLLLAEQLYLSNRLSEALVELETSKQYYIENKTYLLRGRILDEQGNYADAEKSFLRAVYMVPNRMNSRYELMNFYIKIKDTANAVKWANSILEMPVKVSSAQTGYMLQGAKQVLQGIIIQQNK